MKLFTKHEPEVLFDEHQSVYKKLTADELKRLSVGEVIYITPYSTETFGEHSRYPAIISKISSEDQLHVTFAEGIFINQNRTFDYDTYNINWYASVRISMFISTPHGTLRVSACCDEQRPGFEIEHIESDGTATLLALTEYVPFGEQLVDGEALRNTDVDEMERQALEVPIARLAADPENPSDCVVSEGLVTRTWECWPSYHNRTFHVSNTGHSMSTVGMMAPMPETKSN